MGGSGRVKDQDRWRREVHEPRGQAIGGRIIYDFQHVEITRIMTGVVKERVKVSQGLKSSKNGRE